MGRIAAQAAIILRGKDTAAFERNVIGNVKVMIVNASKIKLINDKLNNKTYRSHSGFPGGDKKQTMAQLVTKGGYKKAFEKAIYGMLPANKLRPVMLANLTITE